HPVRWLRPRDGGRAHSGHPRRGLLPEPGPALGPPRGALRPPLVGCLPDRRGAVPGALLAGGVTGASPVAYLPRSASGFSVRASAISSARISGARHFGVGARAASQRMIPASFSRAFVARRPPALFSKLIRGSIR